MNLRVIDRQTTWHNRSLRSSRGKKSPWMGVLEDWPRPRVHLEDKILWPWPWLWPRRPLALALASKTSGLGLGPEDPWPWPWPWPRPCCPRTHPWIMRTVQCCILTTIVLSYKHANMSSSYRCTRVCWFSFGFCFVLGFLCVLLI